MDKITNWLVAHQKTIAEEADRRKMKPAEFVVFMLQDALEAYTGNLIES